MKCMWECTCMLYRWVGEKICNMYGRHCVCAGVFRLTAVTKCQIQREKPRGCPSACLKLRGGGGVWGRFRLKSGSNKFHSRAGWMQWPSVQSHSPESCSTGIKYALCPSGGQYTGVILCHNKTWRRSTLFYIALSDVRCNVHFLGSRAQIQYLIEIQSGTSD